MFVGIMQSGCAFGTPSPRCADAHDLRGMCDAVSRGMSAIESHDPEVAVHLRDHVVRLYPGARVVAIEPLGPDGGATAGATT